MGRKKPQPTSSELITSEGLSRWKWLCYTCTSVTATDTKYRSSFVSDDRDILCLCNPIRVLDTKT